MYSTSEGITVITMEETIEAIPWRLRISILVATAISREGMLVATSTERFLAAPRNNDYSLLRVAPCLPDEAPGKGFL